MDKARIAAEKLAARISDLMSRGMSRERAMMLAVMEAGGKITIVKG